LVHQSTPEFEKTLERYNVFWVFIVGLAGSFTLFFTTYSLSRASLRTRQSEWELLKERESLKASEEEVRRLNRDLERRVTERTAELLEANNQMEAFVYSIAHDLRAPLRSMRGFAQALREDYQVHFDEQAIDYANRIVASAKFMDDLINDLLSFSKITRGDLDLAPINMELILRQVREQLADEIKEKHAVIESPEKLPYVMAHEATVRQIMTNLVCNSLKFVTDSVAPRITVRAEDAKTHWRIWVEDNGIGIAPQYRDRIFGIFERLHGSNYAGTGIGLAIVRKGVERMNGSVGFESEPGKGSRFWFELRKAG
jgi:signal transduction histidine kinase